MADLKDSWEITEPPQNLVEYVSGFRQSLFLAAESAKETLVKSQHKMKSLGDSRAESRWFKAGEVLMLQTRVNSPFRQNSQALTLRYGRCQT